MAFVLAVGAAIRCALMLLSAGFMVCDMFLWCCQDSAACISTLCPELRYQSYPTTHLSHAACSFEARPAKALEDAHACHLARVVTSGTLV